MIVDNELIQLTKSNKLFNGLLADSAKAILKHKRFFKPEEGEIIFSAGDKADAIYLIAEGEVKIKYAESRKVVQKIIFDFFGEDEIISGTDRISSAVVNNKCILYKIDSKELDQLQNNYSAIKDNLMNKNSETVAPEILRIPDNNTDYMSLKEEYSNENFDYVNLQTGKDDNFVPLSDDELTELLDKQKSRRKEYI